MTTMLAPSGHALMQCDHCGQVDDHPKVHLGRIGNPPLGPDGQPDRSLLIVGFHHGTWHHDCTPAHVKRDIIGGSHSQHPLMTARIFAAAEQGTHGDDLRTFIAEQEMPDHGDAQAATTGIDQTMANAILTALSPTSGTATIGTVTVTFPIRCRFDSAMTTTDSGSSTEWSTSGGYTSGTGAPSLGANWAAASAGSRASSTAVTVTNAPAQTWAGNELWDSSGTPLRTFWGALSGGNKTVNSGDTATIASGSLIQQLT